MSAPESIINSLYRAGNLSTKDIQSIVSSFQAIPKQIDEDVDIELNMYDPETRDRIETHVINAGFDYADLAQTRNRNGERGYIREIPSNVYIYPSVHVTNGSITFPTSDFKYGGRAIFNSGAYTTQSNAARFNVTNEISFGGWYKFKQVLAGEGFGHVIGKTNQYGMFVKSATFGINQVYGQVTISTVEKQNTSFTFTPDTWTHVFITWKSPNLKMYINGSLNDTLTSATGALDTTTNDFSLGANNTGLIPVKSGTEYGPQTVIHKEVTSSWVTDHYNGILNTNDGNDEIVTFPMVAHERPITDASVGKCIIT